MARGGRRGPTRVRRGAAVRGVRGPDGRRRRGGGRRRRRRAAPPRPAQGDRHLLHRPAAARPWSAATASAASTDGRRVLLRRGRAPRLDGGAQRSADGGHAVRRARRPRRRGRGGARQHRPRRAGWRSTGARGCSRARPCSCSAPPARSAASRCRRRSCSAPAASSPPPAAASGSSGCASAAPTRSWRSTARATWPSASARPPAARSTSPSTPCGASPPLAAMDAAARFARHVQVGHLAGPELSAAAPAIRSVSLDVRGFLHRTPARGAARGVPRA